MKDPPYLIFDKPQSHPDMIFENDLWDAVASGSILSIVGLFWIIFLVRIVGLRSFSKMTNFDFVMTVAMGSLLAGLSQTTNWIGVAQTMTAMTVLFLTQFSVAKLRRRFPHFNDLLQNKPTLLMTDGKIDREALRTTRVTEDDLMAKLREANALELSSVHAVVLETTGDVSVLHGGKVDEALLNRVESKS